jgi:uncharacterized repeat protein (TIGR03803 family)
MQSQKLSIGFSAVLAILAVTIIMMAAPAVAQTEKVLYNFNYTAKKRGPIFPIGGLVFDAAGNLYGTANAGGGGGDTEFIGGAVFELTKMCGHWTLKTLHSFGSGKDGFAPDAGRGLIFDAAGNLYGTDPDGGAGAGLGIVFELSPIADGAWREKILLNGDGPEGGLIFDAAGNLYGTTYSGGSEQSRGNCQFGCGTAFELSPTVDGGWTQKTLHNFGGAGDGGHPMAALIFDGAGNLYGTTSGGGAFGLGTAFELSPDPDGGWTERILHNFGGVGDGETPKASLILDAAGNLYGTTYAGGAFSLGTAFRLSPQLGGGWTESILHSFGTGEDGSALFAGLIFDASGNLYGTAWMGGAFGGGTLYELIPEAGGDWTEKTLHSFGNGKDGSGPHGELILDPEGNLYGTAGGGVYGLGTVFEVIP